MGAQKFPKHTHTHTHANKQTKPTETTKQCEKGGDGGGVGKMAQSLSTEVKNLAGKVRIFILKLFTSSFALLFVGGREGASSFVQDTC